ncbi:winged helix-turn-helix transcriptional regulator [Prauserella aidingensis]|uniref:winged helix-turn-helix transcriptional regulator n=1 Tax=Prauserella aidingensis TaxID=387890 RepID=UPI0020A4778A|nr:helix-turn-helix domain-containing protein [Prauserella aidingensis]
MTGLHATASAGEPAHRAPSSSTGSAWKPLIIRELAEHGTLRFSELRRRLEPITEKVLPQLRELEEHGLVSRTVHPVVPPHVEYATTEFGESLNRVLEPLGEWGHANAARIAEVAGITVRSGQ